MADIEIFNLRYNPRLSAREHTFMKLMFIIVKIINDSLLVNRFKSKMTVKYLDYDRFCNDSGSDYIQKVHTCPKNDRTI